MAEKRNIFLIGPMGAGKSTIGRTLARQLGLEFYDSDEEIEKRTGADIAWVFDIEGEEGFRKREEKMIAELSQKQGILLSTGGGSVLSKAVRNYLSSRGTVVYLTTSIKKQLERTSHDKKRPLLQNTDDKLQTLTELAAEREPLYKEIADITVSTDEQNIRLISNQIINMLDNLS